MEKLKKNYQKIICFAFISIGLLIIPIVLIFHLNKAFIWHGLFLALIGLTLLPLAEKKK